MHPSLYEDIADHNHQATERLRCSERLSSIKSRLCPCCQSVTESKTTGTSKVEIKTKTRDKAHESSATPLATSTTVDSFGDEFGPHEKQVLVGPFFQAIVPKWSGVIVKSDSKWLGTQVWPLEDGEHSAPIERDSVIGRGRRDCCECRVPHSVECVRFHIAENRMKLKLELGLVFYHWRFHKMGEEVSLRWTDEEEKRFKDIVIFKPQSLRWDRASKYFRGKTREDLISYYFNALLINRRRYQNHVWPKDINSDDEESEFGSVGGSFGLEALSVTCSDMLLCFQNNQCTVLE